MESEYFALFGLWKSVNDHRKSDLWRENNNQVEEIQFMGADVTAPGYMSNMLTGTMAKQKKMITRDTQQSVCFVFC